MPLLTLVLLYRGLLDPLLACSTDGRESSCAKVGEASYEGLVYSDVVHD